MAGIPPPPGGNPVLQKPPGYRDPSAPQSLRPPQRNQPLPPTFRPDTGKRYNRRSHCSCCRCFCCCLLVLIIILFVLALAGALFYLYYQPKLPVFRLQTVKVKQFNVTAKPDGTFISAATDVTVQTTNANGKIGYSYKQGEAMLSAVDDDGDVSLGSGTFPGFQQRVKDSTVVKIVLGVKSVMVDDGVGSRVKSRFQSKELKFLIELRTRLGIHLTNGITIMFPVKIICGEVSLRQMGSGASPSPKCTINLLRWIYLH